MENQKLFILVHNQSEHDLLLADLKSFGFKGNLRYNPEMPAVAFGDLFVNRSVFGVSQDRHKLIDFDEYSSYSNSKKLAMSATYGSVGNTLKADPLRGLTYDGQKKQVPVVQLTFIAFALLTIAVCAKMCRSDNQIPSLTELNTRR